MKYRHSYHAGNFADVHKHVALLALVTALQRKSSGFLYVDTHAGRGFYDLSGSDAQHGGAEARHGVLQLERTGDGGDETLRHYLDAVGAARDAAHAPHGYPGSALLAARALRSQDRALCYELQPPECRALERALGGLRRVRCECADGLRQLPAILPPVERRALILVDPPYEETSADFDASLAALTTILQRLANAVVAIWYPIKDERPISLWLGRVAHALQVPALLSELWMYPRDSRVALNGSGLLIANPPWQFFEQMTAWLPTLGTALEVGRNGGGQAQRWISHDSA